MRHTFRMQKFPENQGYTSYIYLIKDSWSMLLICLIFFWHMPVFVHKGYYAWSIYTT